MRLLRLIIVDLRLIIVKSTIINRRRRILRLIIVKSTIINRTLQLMQLLIVDADFFSRPQISVDLPPLRKKLHAQKLHLIELALK